MSLLPAVVAVEFIAGGLGNCRRDLFLPAGQASEGGDG